ncbi:hypothetical protein V8E36_003266 [Tilletia maclaganii]
MADGEGDEEWIRLTNNVKQDKVIHNRLLLVIGRAGTTTQAIASITVHPDPHSGFQPVQWNVTRSHFKAAIPLRVGDNLITFIGHTQHGAQHELTLRLKYEVLLNNPPLRIAILLAKDSPVYDNESIPTTTSAAHPPTTTHRPHPEATPLPASAQTTDNTNHSQPSQPHTVTDASPSPRPLVDCPPGPIRDKILAGGIKEVQRRVATQAYCWQAFYAEQMHRHHLGRRSFRFEEQPVDEELVAKGELKLEDLLQVHLLRSEHTLAEFHDANNAQQNDYASQSGAMWDWTHQAIAQHPILSKSRTPTAVLTLESHWVPNHPNAPPPSRRQQPGLILAHAALGGSASSPWLSVLEAALQEQEDTEAGKTNEYSIGVMGSHWIWACPSSLDQLTSALMDETRTDERFVVSDRGEGGTAWETLCVGMGAWLHEAGHALGNPHWPSGIMSRGYNEFSRIFLTTEAYRTRLDKPGEQLITPHNDDVNCHLHRAEALRARWHPTMRLPTDEPATPPSLDRTDSSSVETFRRWASLPPRMYASPTGPSFHASEGGAIIAIEIDLDDSLVRLIEFTGQPGGDGARAGDSPVAQYLLEEHTVREAIDAAVASGRGRKDGKVTVRAVGSNLCVAEMGDYFRDGFTQPVPLFVARKCGGGAEGVLAIRAPGVGREVEWTEEDDGDVDESGTGVPFKWMRAFADRMGERPGLKAISIFADWTMRGFQFEYSDGTVQSFGAKFPASQPEGDAMEVDKEEDAQAPSIKHFTFDPSTDGGIAQIIVRAGWWVDAIQFILESGAKTEIVGNLGGGNLHVLVPPPGKQIIGIHGSFDEWVRSVGICYEASSDTSSPPPLDDVDPGQRRQLARQAPQVYATAHGPIFRVPEGQGLVHIQIGVEHPTHPWSSILCIRQIVFREPPGFDEAHEKRAGKDKEPVTEYLLDEATVRKALDDAVAAGIAKEDTVVSVYARGTSHLHAELSDYFHQGFARPVPIFAARRCGKGQEGVHAILMPQVGTEVREADDEDGDLAVEEGDTFKFVRAFANQVGERPGLTAISILAGAETHGFQFEYADGTVQSFGSLSLPAQKEGVHDDGYLPRLKRFTFDPSVDGGIAQVIIYVGAWIDAIQFVLESGAKTELMGDLRGGKVHVLASPQGEKILGLHGSFGERIRSVGICYEAPAQADAPASPPLDLVDPGPVRRPHRKENSPPRFEQVTVRAKGTNGDVGELDDYFRDGLTRPVALFASRRCGKGAAGVYGFRAAGVGNEVDWTDEKDGDTDCGDDYAYHWMRALANSVCERPGLTAITIYADYSVRGFSFEYADGSSQDGDDSDFDEMSEDEDDECNSQHGATVVRRYTFDPSVDGGIAKIAVRAGCWIDAIQFVLESGAETELLGNTNGGELHVLEPPPGRKIVGIHGSYDERIVSIGICYSTPDHAADAQGSPPLDLTDPGPLQRQKNAPPRICAGDEGPTFHASEGNGLSGIEVYLGHALIRRIEFKGKSGGNGAQKDGEPVVEYLLDFSTMRAAVDAAKAAVPRNADARVTVEVLGTNRRTSQLDDYFRDGITKVVTIFASASGKVQAAGVQAVRALGVGEEVDWAEDEDGDVEKEDGSTFKWMRAFANQTGARPGLKTISIFADWTVRGFEFEYADGTLQSFGDKLPASVIEGEATEVQHKDDDQPGPVKRFTFDPATDGGIARIVVRAGCWIDAVQFVLDSGAKTDLVGNVRGGERHVLESTPGKKIVGFHGSFDEWVRSIGICYEA